MKKVALRAVLGAGLCGLCGCSGSQTAEVTYRFENVRLISGGSGLDEWREIKKVLDESAVAPVVGRVVKEKGSIGGTRVRDYEATFRVESLSAMDDIDEGLRDLAEERFAGERVQFSRGGVRAEYRSTFVATAIEVTVRGVTTPRALVFLYPTPTSAPLVATADGLGRFALALPALPEEGGIYGYSQAAGGGSGAGRKYFRIDPVSQRQETLTEDEFYDEVPRPKPAEK